MNAALPLLLIAFAASPDRETILAEWTKTASAIESADVELVVVRDSRDATFGNRRKPAEAPRVRLRFDQDLRRLDALRMTALRRDGRTKQAEADPDRARIEFRNVLLEEHLAGSQRVPRLEPATLIIHADGEETGQQFSLLDRLLIEAPLWSSQPFRIVDQSKVELQADLPQSGWHRATVERSDDTTLDLWLERETPYRPRRITGRRKDLAIWQVDLIYASAESRFPETYFVQTIGAAGEPLEFVEASLARADTPMPPEALLNLATIEHANRDEVRPRYPLLDQARSAIRKSLDSLWLPAVVFAYCSLRWLRRRTSSDAEPAEDVAVS